MVLSQPALRARLHPVYCIAFCRESVFDMLADFPIVFSKEDFHRTLALKNVAPTDRNPTPKEWQFQMPGVERYKDQSLTVDNNGAYDYAADTKGYTYGALLEYQS